MACRFDEIINRRDTGSMKWDVPEGELPMWVADMDFKTVPEVIKAMIERADEIHCDLTKLGSSYTPFASVSELCKNNSITCVALTKAFNLAGLQTAAVIVPNAAIRHKYLWENRKFAEEFIQTQIPEVSAVHADATYLLWMDCKKVIGDSSELCRFIRENNGLYLSDGSEYRDRGGFLRMNLACPREQLKEGLRRLKEGVAAYERYVCERC